MLEGGIVSWRPEPTNRLPSSDKSSALAVRGAEEKYGRTFDFGGDVVSDFCVEGKEGGSAYKRERMKHGNRTESKGRRTKKGNDDEEKSGKEKIHR